MTDTGASAERRPRLAFIDHSFHRVSHSSRFFLDVLESWYSVTVFYDERWRGGLGVDVAGIISGGFDTVVYWQCLGSLRDLIRLRRARVIWVPMFDEVHERPPVFWTLIGALGLKVICFSRALYARLDGRGIDAGLFQFFPEPSAQSVSYESPRVFFWQRRAGFGWSLVKELLTGTPVTAVVLKNDPDPGEYFQQPPPSDIDRFHIHIVDDVRIADQGSSAAYDHMLSRCNVFVAPRLREGVGLSFLEAMAMGMCVIGHDSSTMNEYITSGHNGFLWSSMDPRPITFEKLEEIGLRARDSIREGRVRWVASLATLEDFVATPTRKRIPSLLLVSSIVGYAGWCAFRTLRLWTTADTGKTGS